MKLYEITEAMLTLQAMLEEGIEDEQELTDTLWAMSGEYEYKMEQYCKVIKNLEADATAIDSELKRLTDKKKTLKNSVERLKAYMFESMKATNTPKIKGELFTISVQKNGGKLPVILDVDTAELPDNLVRVVESPDMEAIAKLLENDNCKYIHNYAHFGERGESLRIK